MYAVLPFMAPNWPMNLVKQLKSWSEQSPNVLRERGLPSTSVLINVSEPLHLSPVAQPYLRSFSTCLPFTPGLEAFKMASGRRSTGSGTAPALYKSTKAISITAERSDHCVCASVHFAHEPFQRALVLRVRQNQKK